MAIYTHDNTARIGRNVEVRVNGNVIDNVVFADTVRGKVEYCPEPVRVKKGADFVYTRVLRGNVTVEDKQ